jgi:streptogramin lyase
MKTLRYSILAAFALAGADTARAQLTYEPFLFTTVAGRSTSLGSADGTGGAAQFFWPTAIVADRSGNFYLADTENHTIRKITASGVVTTFAGLPGAFGNVDGAGSAARFFRPHGVAVDSANNIYVTTDAHTIRRITPDGTVTTLAGSTFNNGSSDGNGSSARFSSPWGIASDSSGNVYVAEFGNHTIRKITPAGDVTTLAGSAGNSGSSDGSGTDARFNSPYGLAIDSSNNIFVADSKNSRIRKITPDGVVTTFARSNWESSNGAFPQHITIDGANNLFVTENSGSGGAVRKISPAGDVTTLAGNAWLPGNVDANGTSARFLKPQGIALDPVGNLFVVDVWTSTVRRVTPAGDVTTFVGTPGVGAVDGTPSAARFFLPFGVAVDSNTNIFVADSGNHTVRKITAAGDVSTVAGLACQPGASNGFGRDARFASPFGIVTDPSGTIYVSDSGNSSIRKISPTGDVTTFATGFWNPAAIAIDAATNIYVAGNSSRVIHKISASGIVSTLAGLFGVSGSTDGDAATARFNYPLGVAVDSQTNVYVADTGNCTIRKVTPTGNVITLAGLAGAGDMIDGPVNTARFRAPRGVAVDSVGNLYVTDIGFPGGTIRRISPDGVVTTLAGSPSATGSVGGSGGQVRFSTPTGIAVTASGKIYVADADNQMIRTDFPTFNLGLSGDGNRAQLTLNTFVGVRYQIDYNDNLGRLNWILLTNFTTTNITISVVDSQISGVTNRLYRAAPVP